MIQRTGPIFTQKNYSNNVLVFKLFFKVMNIQLFVKPVNHMNDRDAVHHLRTIAYIQIETLVVIVY